MKRRRRRMCVFAPFCFTMADRPILNVRNGLKAPKGRRRPMYGTGTGTVPVRVPAGSLYQPASQERFHLLYLESAQKTGGIDLFAIVQF